MPCFYPQDGFLINDGGVKRWRSYVRHGDDVLSSMTVPCENCIGCRMERSRQWTVRCQHEVRMCERAGLPSSFVTLTLDDRNLPEHGEIDYRLCQLFHKRVRKNSGCAYKHLTLSEYGGSTFRPHFHCVMMGVSFDRGSPVGKGEAGDVCYSSPQLDKWWTLGHSSFGDATAKSIGYCTRHNFKDAMRYPPGFFDEEWLDEETGEISKRRGPFLSFSRGIGRAWYEQFGRTDCHRHDRIVLSDGQIVGPIKAYDDWLASSADGECELLELKAKRLEKARELGLDADSTRERLAVREQVFKARIRGLTKGL